MCAAEHASNRSRSLVASSMQNTALLGMLPGPGSTQVNTKSLHASSSILGKCRIRQ